MSMRVTFYWSDADPALECECGAKFQGDSAVDAFRAWWQHKAEEHPGE